MDIYCGLCVKWNIWLLNDFPLPLISPYYPSKTLKTCDGATDRFLSSKLLSGGTDQGNGMLNGDATSPSRPSHCDKNIGARPELSRGDDKNLPVSLPSQLLYMVGSKSSRSGTQFPVFDLLG
ncbi:hypothetical protein U1Q18_028943 [Sarracenia purpurea var. burkii]